MSKVAFSIGLNFLFGFATLVEGVEYWPPFVHSICTDCPLVFSTKDTMDCTARVG